jgi:hypothetical protein
MFKKSLALAAAIVGMNAAAEDVTITGTVASKCVITTDTVGVYGNPTPSELSTAPADGGVLPIVRYDVLQADFYKARITYPESFSESPALTDVVTWTGDVTVAEVTDAGMSAYDTSKVEFNNVTEVDLTIAGSTWFKVESTADYGVGKAFPAGTYRAVVSADCIAL